MPKNLSPGRNVQVLCTIALLQGLVFYGPVATLYRRAAGVSMLQIALIESVSLVLSLLLEMPWGAAADRIGYKNTLVVCCGLFFVSKIVFWQASGFGGFLAERVLLAVVVSGLSGVDSALLYLSCPPGRRQKAFALYEALGTAGMMAASLLYSLCFGGDYRRAAFWTMIAYGAAMCLSFFLVEPPHGAQPEGEGGSLFRVVLSVVKRPRLLLLLLSIGLFRETRQTVTVFLNQLQYQRAGIPDGLLGVLLAGMQALGFLGVLSPALTKRLGERRTSLLLTAAGAASCVLLAHTESPVLSVAGVALLVLAGSLLSPLQSVLQNREVRTAYRATELSVYAMVLDAISAGANVAFGRAADVSLPLAFQMGAAACVLACGFYGILGVAGRRGGSE